MSLNIGARQIDQALSELQADIALKFNMGSPIKNIGLSTGFADLDTLTSGLRRGYLTVIGARPSMGKSSFALQIALHNALDSNLAAVVFSMELPSTAVAARCVCQRSSIDIHRLRNGRLDADQRTSFSDAVELIRKAPLYIDDTPALTAKNIRRRAEQLLCVDGVKLSLIVIDGLQFIDPICTQNVSDKDYKKVMILLKSLARDLDVAVILLTQLKRNLEKRKDKRPRICDLPSSLLIQYADLLMFLYRDEYYVPDSAEPGVAEVLVSRNRHGPTGTVVLEFVGEFVCFKNRQVDDTQNNIQ